MRKEGDYEWEQLSMWDGTPASGITKFVPIGNTGHVAHYKLLQIVSVDADGKGWKTRLVGAHESVPNSVLSYGNTGYYTISDNKSFYHDMPI